MLVCMKRERGREEGEREMGEVGAGRERGWEGRIA